jgi:hypothetical protein
VDLASGKPDRELRLAEGTEAVCLTPDGRALYAAAGAGERGGKLQVIDPATLELRKTLTLPTAPYDLAASDAGMVFLSGAAGDWTDVTVVDVPRETVAARWGGVWTRSLVQLSPDQQRLFVSSQGVIPGYVEALAVPKKFDDKPAPYRSPAGDKHPLGGEFVVTPDGRFLLCKTGTVLRLSATRDDDLRHVATLAPFAAAAVDPDRGVVLLLSGDGVLTRCSYPDFKPQATQPLGVVAYQAVFDGKQGRLYVAGFDPRTVGGRPRARGFGDLFVYDLGPLFGLKGE